MLILVALSWILEVKNGLQKEDSFNTREEGGTDQSNSLELVWELLLNLLELVKHNSL